MGKSVLQMWAEATEKVETINPAQLVEEIETGDVLLLDVRLPTEIERRGRIKVAVPVPRQVVEWWADPESPYFRSDGVFGDFDQRIVTVCDGGGNGTFTAVTRPILLWNQAGTASIALADITSMCRTAA